MTTEPRPSVLTPDEHLVLIRLGQAWLAFLALEPSQGDKTEFAQAHHKAQNIILARPTWRALEAEKRAAL